jgi:hypothetical protein
MTLFGLLVVCDSGGVGFLVSTFFCFVRHNGNSSYVPVDKEIALALVTAQ